MTAFDFFNWYDNARAKGFASIVGQRMLADSPEWKIDHTGGGCLAWSLDIEYMGAGHYIWITDESGSELGESLDETYCIGVYDADGEVVETQYAESLEAALTLARAFRLSAE